MKNVLFVIVETYRKMFTRVHDEKVSLRKNTVGM